MKQAIKFLSFVVVAALMLSCSGGAEYYIDNPTSEAITVSVDGKDAVTVNPGEYKKIEGTLADGEHTMKVGENELKFSTDGKSVMLNPTGAVYVKVKQEYGVGMASEDGYTTIEIDGNKYEGPFEIQSDPAVVVSGVSYGVDEDFPNQVMMARGQTKAVKTKLFRKDDFFKFYKSEY
jgi:hypothetical protein